MPIVDLARDSQGSGPLLVLVHGITENRHSWDPLTDDLARDHRVLRVDLRGHGESRTGDGYGLSDYAADIAALPEIDESPFVVGHSLGGTVATAYAAQFDTRGVLNVDQSLDLGGLQSNVKAVEPMLRGDEFGAVISALFESLRGATPDEQWARLTALRRPDQDVVLGTWSLLLDHDNAAVVAAVHELASRVHVPYLALDGIDPGPGHAEWLAGEIPQAQLEIWPDIGHYPHLVDPQRFLDRLRAFEQTL